MGRRDCAVWLGYRDAVEGLVDREDDVQLGAAATELVRAFSRRRQGARRYDRRPAP